MKAFESSHFLDNVVAFIWRKSNLFHEDYSPRGCRWLSPGYMLLIIATAERPEVTAE